MGYLASYQGDYLRSSQRGDPIFGLLAGAIPFVKKGISVVRRLLPKRAPPGLGPALRGAAPTLALGAGVAAAGAAARRFGPGAPGAGKRRRMNVANPKALRRAIRRTDGFVKLARRTLKGTGFVIARRGFSKAARARRR